METGRSSADLVQRAPRSAPGRLRRGPWANSLGDLPSPGCPISPDGLQLHAPLIYEQRLADTSGDAMTNKAQDRRFRLIRSIRLWKGDQAGGRQRTRHTRG